MARTDTAGTLVPDLAETSCTNSSNPVAQETCIGSMACGIVHMSWDYGGRGCERCKSRATGVPVVSNC